jgi:hypothetical protein
MLQLILAGVSLFPRRPFLGSPGDHVCVRVRIGQLGADKKCMGIRRAAAPEPSTTALQGSARSRWSKKVLASSALAGGATSPNTVKAISVETKILMAVLLVLSDLRYARPRAMQDS